MSGNGSEDNELLAACEEYGELKKQEEVLKLSLAGKIDGKEKVKKLIELTAVRERMSEALGKINGNGRHPYLSH